MSQGPLYPNLSQKVQKEVSQMANRKLSCAMLYKWFKCKLKPPKNWLCESLMAAIHRKSCIKFIRKSLVVSVVLVVSVGKAIVSKHVF